MSRTLKFFYNSISTAIYQIIVMIVGIITPRIMLKYYGSEINGLVSSITQFISYFALVEAGLSGAATYALYKPLANDDYLSINGIISAARKFYNQAGYTFVFLIVGFSAFYSSYVKTDLLSKLEVGLLVLILGTSGVLDFFTLSKYSVLLTADQKTYVISLSSIIYVILNTIIIVILGTKQINIVVLRLAALLSVFLRTFILMIYVKVNYKYIRYDAEPDTEALNKRWDALYLQILGVIQTGIPIVILTLVTKDLKLVSVYSIFNMIIVGINGILSIFHGGLSASFGDVIARREKSVLQKSYTEFEFSYYTLITAVYSITFITIMPFIRVYTSGINDINYDVPMIGFLFVLNGLLYNLKTPQGMLVISAGMYRETRVQSTIQGLIVVILGLVLTPSIGIYGILIASILSNIYRDIDLMFFIPRNLTELPVINSAIRILRVFMVILIICLPVKFIELNPGGYIQWIIHAIIIGIYSCIIVLIISLLFDRNALKEVSNRVTGMVRR
ncbi:MAG TPA: hypothetical protein DIV40_08770 [Clostridiales bacterium]|jgi:hypothetical protein|nr:hypothetical protein [Clostridiales bacterium]